MIDLGSVHEDGVFLRREVLAHGYSDKDLYGALRAGAISRVRHGAYIAADSWTAAGPERRHLLRARAAVRSHEAPVVLSHVTAAVAHGLRLHKPDLRRVHLNCLDGSIARTTGDIVYHRTPATEADLVELDGVRAMSPLRAALETASMSDVPSGVVVLDSVIDLGLAHPDDVSAGFRRFRGLPHTRRMQLTVRLVREGSNSVGESLMRVLFWENHVPPPVLQFEVRDDSGMLIARTDFAWPGFGLLGEFDGRMKYDHQDESSSRDALWREKRREDLVRELTGFLMIRFVWADLHDPQRTARRILDQLNRGRSLRTAARR